MQLVQSHHALDVQKRSERAVVNATAGLAKPRWYSRYVLLQAQHSHVGKSWYLAHSIASVGGLDAYSRLVQGRAFVRHGI